jgi:uncharacterized membrane protein YdjX (TVP38/TMEM64 family)
MGKRKEKAKKLLADKHFEETKHYSKRTAATVISVASAVICILALIGAIILRDHFSAENLDKLQAFVSEHWLAGALIFMAICATQVIIALIPGEAVEIAAGVIFGSFWGTVLCLVGIMTGSVIVILLVRKFGRKFVESLYPREKIDSLPILNDPKKRNAVIALLFFIPGTPKDLITYIVGLTEVSIPMYILLTTVARVPSIIMSTFGGDAFGDGNILKAIIIFGATALISGAGYLVYIVIQKKMNRSSSEQDKKAD